MSRNELNSVETSIEQATAAIELGKCLDRLYENKDFQLLIAKEFFVSESVNLVGLLGKTTDPVQKEQILNNMMAISGLKSYFAKVTNSATQAIIDLEDNEQARQSILIEGLDIK